MVAPGGYYATGVEGMVLSTFVLFDDQGAPRLHLRLCSWYLDGLPTRRRSRRAADEPWAFSATNIRTASQRARGRPGPAAWTR